MTTTLSQKPALIVASGDRGEYLLYTGTLSLDAVRPCIGRTVNLATMMAHDRADYRIESVHYSRETGDYTAWVVPLTSPHGHHISIHEKR